MFTACVFANHMHNDRAFVCFVPILQGVLPVEWQLGEKVSASSFARLRTFCGKESYRVCGHELTL